MNFIIWLVTRVFFLFECLGIDIVKESQGLRCLDKNENFNKTDDSVLSLYSEIFVPV